MIRIEIEGARFAPSWEATQAIIRTCLNGEPMDSADMDSTDQNGRLTRISRIDGASNYRAHGDYRLLWVKDGEEEDIFLRVL